MGTWKPFEVVGTAAPAGAGAPLQVTPGNDPHPRITPALDYIFKVWRKCNPANLYCSKISFQKKVCSFDSCTVISKTVTLKTWGNSILCLTCNPAFGQFHLSCKHQVKFLRPEWQGTFMWALPPGLDWYETGLLGF